MIIEKQEKQKIRLKEIEDGNTFEFTGSIWIKVKASYEFMERRGIAYAVNLSDGTLKALRTELPVEEVNTKLIVKGN